MHIVICADGNIIVGLHVTLQSLLSKTRDYVNIHLVYNGISDLSFKLIEKTISPFADNCKLYKYEFEASNFGNLRSLRMNRYCYVKLMIADIVPVARVVYLDSDLLVNIDLSNLYHMDLSGYVFAASGVQPAASTMEGTFFQEIGHLDEDAMCFNSGVMLMDLDAWRREVLLERCMEFANKWSHRLPTQDQTILNYVAYKNQYLMLSDCWNTHVYTRSPPPDLSQKAIFHFLGVPKPWDLGGEWLHGSYSVFNEALSATALSGYRPSRDITAHRVLHSARVSRSYYRVLMEKMRQA